MWILNFIPDIVFHAIVIAGILGMIASFFLGYMPFISLYKTPIQIISVIILVFGVWVEGANSNNESWKLKVKELEAKVSQAQIKSNEINTKLVEKIAQNQKIVKDKQNENSKAIIKYVTDDCRLSNVAVILHNSSSQNELPSSTIGTVTGTSEVTTAELLGTVNENYGTYYEIVNKLKAWQSWYKEQKQIFESVK
jgi:hypothetical protein